MKSANSARANENGGDGGVEGPFAEGSACSNVQSPIGPTTVKPSRVLSEIAPRSWVGYAIRSLRCGVSSNVAALEATVWHISPGPGKAAMGCNPDDSGGV